MNNPQRPVQKDSADPFAPKPCRCCGAPVPHVAGEPPRCYRRRNTCGPECRRVLTGQKLRHSPPAKWCPVCGVMFCRQDGEEADTYRRRKTCSPSCAASIRNKKTRDAATSAVPPKACPVCGTTLARRRGEKIEDYRDRVCCSLACSYTYRSAPTLPRVSVYPVPWQRVRATIRKRDGHRCRLCGISVILGLHVHHIDYDKTNLSHDNLISLCGSCHARTNYNRAHWQALFTGMMEADRKQCAA